MLSIYTSDNSVPFTQSIIIDISNPLYLGSSNNPNALLILNVFTRIGFSTWKRSMIITLFAKNKLTFVYLSSQKPSDVYPLLPNWSRVNSMIIRWLLNPFHRNIAESLIFLPIANDIWEELNSRYEQDNGSLIYHIQHQLYSFSQGIDDFSTYFTKISKIWDELRIVQSIPACTCAAVSGIMKYLNVQCLIQLLMGLKDTYKIIQV
ncbi:hypothetical protein Lser_V15G25012 [Lactuca serriola]